MFFNRLQIRDYPNGFPFLKIFPGKTVGRFDKLIDRTLSLVVITGLAYIGLGA